MKSFKLLLVAVATIGLTSLFACGGETNNEGTNDSTQTQVEPTVEQTVDSTSTADSLKK